MLQTNKRFLPSFFDTINNYYRREVAWKGPLLAFVAPADVVLVFEKLEEDWLECKYAGDLYWLERVPGRMVWLWLAAPVEAWELVSL